MPSRYRPLSVVCNVFVLFVLAKIGFIYYTTMVVVWAPKVEGKFRSGPKMLQVASYFLHFVNMAQLNFLFFSKPVHIK